MSQLYCIVGLPAAGKGSVCKAIKDSSKSKIAVVSSGAIARRLATAQTDEAMKDGQLFPLEDLIRAEMSREVRVAFGSGADAVLLDGAPRFADQLRWVESEFFDKDPVYVRINAPDEDTLVRRLASRARDEFDTSPEKARARIRHQQHLLGGVEEVIFRMGLNYFSIMNDDVVRAVEEFKSIVPPPGRGFK